MTMRIHGLTLFLSMLLTTVGLADDWPAWRGPHADGVSAARGVPVSWDGEKHVRWKTALPGEGASTPIVWGDAIFLTSAEQGGRQRLLHRLDRATGRVLWSATLAHDRPEGSSALTGHAAASAVTDGKHVVAVFGSAGVVCHDFAGRRLWKHDLGEFETELGLASSPVIDGDLVFLVCDHDGRSFTTFDSYLLALEVKTGKVRWKTERPGLERSWSTPLLVPAGNGRTDLVVCGMDHVRGYDPATGRERWRAVGTTGWVAPSPVFGGGRVFVTSGKDGPTLALRPGGTGDVTATHIDWKQERGGSYVCSPLLHGGLLYNLTETGWLTCHDARTGAVRYHERLGRKFAASPVAVEDRLYLLAEDGTGFVLRAGPRFEIRARNVLGEETLASPVPLEGCLLLRGQKHLFCLTATDP